MVACLQRCIVFCLALAALACWLVGMWWGRPWLGASLLPVVVAVYASTLGAEFVAVYLAKDKGVENVASAGQLFHAWQAELLAAALIFCWRQPFRTNTEPDTLTAAEPGRRGVVLVHGMVCNRAFWNPWLRSFRALGIPAIAVNLEPVFGSIDEYAPTLDSAVSRMEAATGQPVVLVGHSMGGLAIRAWLRHSSADTRVHHVVTIGTPHFGTRLARHSRTVNGRQMRIGSQWLSQLAAEEPAGRAGMFTCLFSWCDNIVFPASLALWPGASNRHVLGAAHVRLAFEPVVFEEVCRWLLDNGGVSESAQLRLSA